ncbi:MAG: SDR family oxidoreductase [Candidatus Levyibacteriota bacterium]
MKKILITGASGFLGAKLYTIFGSDPTVIVGGTYSSKERSGLLEMDVTNREQTMKIITGFHPDIVIHTVALSDTDYCEEHKSEAERINYEGTVNIVAACQEIGARLDYISTIYVFNGEEEAYNEDMNPTPGNWYGKTKLKAEEVVQTLPRHGIYRSDKIFGFNGFDQENGYLSKIIKGEPFAVNADLLAHPIFADDYGHAIQRMQELDEVGILHVAGPERITKFELMKSLAKIIGKESVVQGIRNKNQAAKRPEMSINTEKAKSLGITFTSLKEAYRIIGEQITRSKEKRLPNKSV